jgi:hypothetical protein
MTPQRDGGELGSTNGQTGGKWPAKKRWPHNASAKRRGHGPHHITEVCSKVIVRMNANLAATVAEAARASAQSCVYAASGDLVATFRWDAHAEALSREVKSLARSVARWKQMRRRLARGGASIWL